jgi:hypothetical protein
LHQQHIAKGEDPCGTWKYMKVLLHRQFDHSLESETKIIAGCLRNPFPTKLSQHLSLVDSIVGNECLQVHKHQDGTIKHNDKEKIVSAAIPRYKNICSTRCDPVVRAADMNEPTQHASAINQASMGPKNLHCSRQITLPLSSKRSDNMDNIESEFSVRTKQNVCSSWITDSRR